MVDRIGGLKMNQKELVQKFFKGRAVSRPPFLPLLGTYLTKVDQVPIPSLLQDDSILYSSLINTQKLLGYDAIILPLDATLEAEAFGASIDWKDKEMPVVSEYLQVNQEIEETNILEKGRIPIIKEVVERLVTVQGKNLPIIATITGPLTILKNLYGEEIESSIDLMKSRVEVITQALIGLCKTFGDAKVDGILINEDSAINPLQWEELSHCYKPLFNVINFYNVFGILRFPSELGSSPVLKNLPDTVLCSKEFVFHSNGIKTKGVALPESVWKDNLDVEQLTSFWKENKKRKLFFSTSSPLNLEISLSDLQYKIAVLCDEGIWE